MFSVHGFSKLLILVAVIALVWIAFRVIGRLDQARKQQARAPQPRRSQARRGVEDTVKCKVCGAYVAARGASPCGRADCPY